jgi:hypothetical protein
MELVLASTKLVRASMELVLASTKLVRASMELVLASTKLVRASMELVRASSELAASRSVETRVGARSGGGGVAHATSPLATSTDDRITLLIGPLMGHRDLSAGGERTRQKRRPRSRSRGREQATVVQTATARVGDHARVAHGVVGRPQPEPRSGAARGREEALAGPPEARVSTRLNAARPASMNERGARHTRGRSVAVLLAVTDLGVATTARGAAKELEVFDLRDELHVAGLTGSQCLHVVPPRLLQ